MAITDDQTVLIVGAGVFGLSTARTLLRRGHPASNILIIDRAPILPAVDAAGTDINKIVRFDYEDPIYSEMALKAIKELRKPEWEGVYHESGVLVFGDVDHHYFQSSLANVKLATPQHTVIHSQSDLNTLFPKAPPLLPPGKTAMAYLNREGGWAEAGRSVALVTRWLREAGVIIIEGQEVEQLIFEQKKGLKDVKGVVTKEGRQFRADLVILASGAWTPLLLEKSKVEIEPELLKATGQAIAILQLTREEMEKHKDDPVLFSMYSGFYMFPPTSDGQVKFVFHKPGYLNTISCCSCPQTVLSPGGENGAIPKSDLSELRLAIEAFRPALAGREVIETRLCWYIDTPDSNFLLDYHPDYPSLFLATGGSGHGYKFLPILGDYIVDRVNETLPAILVDKWAYKSRVFGLEGSRAPVERKELSCEQLVEAKDLTAQAWVVARSRL